MAWRVGHLIQIVVTWDSWVKKMNSVWMKVVAQEQQQPR